MSARTLRHALEAVTNVGVLVVCVAVTFVLLGGTSQSTGSAQPSALRSGEEFLDISTFHISEAHRLWFSHSARGATFAKRAFPSTNASLLLIPSVLV
jgi:hypothetical protein